MGCLFSKLFGGGNQNSAEEQPAERPQYSWEKRERIDPKDFTISGLKGETAGRVPGTINGQQFIIDNCEDCNIYLYDHINTITIDDCKNCRFFVGPVQTSLFIRDCENCTLIVACQQFRTRDCRRLDAMLLCTTQPIIEASTGVKFGCFSYNYPQLDGQLRSAGLCVFNNSWSVVHDFTPVQDNRNYSLMSENTEVDQILPRPDGEQFSSIDVTTDQASSVVPVTMGNRRKPPGESCLVVFFHDARVEDRARTFIDTLRSAQPELQLMQTKQVRLEPADAERVFMGDAYGSQVARGEVIGLEYAGPDCVTRCRQHATHGGQGDSTLTFVSASPGEAAQQIENFYNYADLQMAV